MTMSVSPIQALISRFVARRIQGSHDVALATANLMLRFVSATRWTHNSELISEVRELGRTLINAQPREFACGNVVRRVLAIIRETDRDHDKGDVSGQDIMSSMFNLLSTNTEQDQGERATERPRDTKADIIEGIQELIDEIDNMDDTISGLSLDMIHENEVLLTPTPESRTVRDFLKRAAQKRKFSVLVTESYPNGVKAAHEAVRELAKAGIETVLIPDTTVLAVMSRVGKVIIGSRAVLANGGCMSSAGVSLVCECAKESRTPVLCVTALYKLSPLYPFDTESVIEVGDTSQVIPFADSECMSQLDAVNPMYDYVAPDYIDIYLTNM